MRILLLTVAIVGAVVYSSRASAATTIVVNSTVDPGNGICNAAECTLREALDASNAASGATVIEFAIAGVGTQTIVPASALPHIFNPTTLDGTSQPGYLGTPIVEIDGSLTNGSGIVIWSGNTTVKGLVVNNFEGNGIQIISDYNRIEANFIGTDITGQLAAPNSGNGIEISGSYNTLIGNTVSANGADGVFVLTGDANLLQGNLIGTTAGGGAVLGNSSHGITLYTDTGATEIGGDEPGEGNVISGNYIGVAVATLGPASGTMITGNKIGVDASASYAIPNAFSGILLNDEAVDTTIGGTTLESGNVISGNGNTGIAIFGSIGTAIFGNKIGTDGIGTAPIPNGIGIAMDMADGAIVGGVVAGSGNLISGNSSSGIGVYSSFGTTSGLGIEIIGNRIGTNTLNQPSLGNGSAGILIAGVSDVLVGQPGAGANTIADNNPGVLVLGDTGIRNRIRGNSIHSNAIVGIDLVDAGNLEIAAPQHSTDPLMGTACPGCTIDVYSDPQNQGRYYEGSTTADTFGSWQFTGSVTGPHITATATDSAGNTSEFSAPQFCQACPPVGGQVELLTSRPERDQAILYVLFFAVVAGLTAFTIRIHRGHSLNSRYP